MSSFNSLKRGGTTLLMSSFNSDQNIIFTFQILKLHTELRKTMWNIHVRLFEDKKDNILISKLYSLKAFSIALVTAIKRLSLPVSPSICIPKGTPPTLVNPPGITRDGLLQLPAQA